MNINKQLKEARENKHLTIVEVAKKTGINRNTIANIEKGGDAKMSTVMVLAKYYKVKLVVK